MLVVADASPLVGLVRIGHADILAALYGTVVVPPRVAAELLDPRRPTEVQAFMTSPPPWLSVRAPSRVEPIADLDPGELEAISLARELAADLLLIDEARGERPRSPSIFRRRARPLSSSTPRTPACSRT